MTQANTVTRKQGRGNEVRVPSRTGTDVHTFSVTVTKEVQIQMLAMCAEDERKRLRKGITGPGKLTLNGIVNKALESWLAREVKQ